VEGVDEANRLLRNTAAEARRQALERARQLKSEMDDREEPYRMRVEARLYVAEFDADSNKYGDKEKGRPGLLDVLMEKEWMQNQDAFAISFVFGSDIDGIEGEEPDSFFVPTSRDAAWNIVYDETFGNRPRGRLCYPLRLLVAFQDVAIQDFAAIRRFGFELVESRLSMG